MNTEYDKSGGYSPEIPEQIKNLVYNKVAEEIRDGKINDALMLRIKVENPGSDWDVLYAKARVNQYFLHYISDQKRRQQDAAELQLNSAREKNFPAELNDADGGKARQRDLKFQELQKYSSVECFAQLKVFNEGVSELSSARNLHSPLLYGFISYLALFFLLGVIYYFKLILSGSLAGFGSGLEAIATVSFILSLYFGINRYALIKKLRMSGIRKTDDSVSLIKKMTSVGVKEAADALRKYNTETITFANEIGDALVKQSKLRNSGSGEYVEEVVLDSLKKPQDEYLEIIHDTSDKSRDLVGASGKKQIVHDGNLMQSSVSSKSLSRRRMYISPAGDILVYKAGLRSKLYAFFLGAVYYHAHGMRKSFLYGLIYYCLYFWIGFSDASNNTPLMVVASSIFWRSVWHFFNFDDEYRSELKRVGFDEKHYDEERVISEIERASVLGYRFQFISDSAFVMIKPSH